MPNQRSEVRNAQRRSLLKATAGGAAAVAVIGGLSRLTRSEGDARSGSAEPATLHLVTHGESDFRALDIPLGDKLLMQVSPTRWRSEQLPTSTHSMVALTWRRDGPQPVVHIKSRVGGAWQPWRKLSALSDCPDTDSGEGVATAGTDLAWIGKSDGIQIEVTASRPDLLTLVLLHPSSGASLLQTTRSARAPRITTRSTAKTRIPRPEMFSRRDWGADERWRTGDPVYNETIKQVHVHHTVNGNDYRKRDVPALLRGIYRYHTHNLGWSDIGYNFLVDRFGRVWVGRAGGPARAVRGAHTLGFNSESTGVSVIGNYDAEVPNRATLNAVAAVAAWKLARHGRDPKGHVRVESDGSDKYPRHRVARLPVIDGHRDTNDTACPGGHLYQALPKIRRKAKRRIEAFRSAEPTTPKSRAGH